MRGQTRTQMRPEEKQSHKTSKNVSELKSFVAMIQYPIIMHVWLAATDRVCFRILKHHKRCEW